MKALACALMIVVNLMLYGAAGEIAGLHPFVTTPILAVLNFLVIVIHELGHVLGFLKIKGRVERIVVLFVQYDVPKKRLSLRSTQHDGDIGGFVMGTYPDPIPSREEAITVSAAGPLANLVTGLTVLFATWAWSVTAIPAAPIAPTTTIAVGTTITAPVASVPSSGGVEMAISEVNENKNLQNFASIGYTVLILFAVLSLGIAVVNLIPFNGSDGAKILGALRY